MGIDLTYFVNFGNIINAKKYLGKIKIHKLHIELLILFKLSIIAIISKVCCTLLLILKIIYKHISTNSDKLCIAVLHPLVITLTGLLALGLLNKP